MKKTALFAGVVLTAVTFARAAENVEGAYGSASKMMTNKVAIYTAMPDVVASEPAAPQLNTIYFYGFDGGTTDAKVCQAMAADMDAKLEPMRQAYPDRVLKAKAYIPPQDCRGSEPMRICYSAPCGVMLTASAPHKFLYRRRSACTLPPVGFTVASKTSEGRCGIIQSIELW